MKTLYHADGSELTIMRVQDVEPILEHNKQLQTIEQKSDWGRHRYSIPNVILEGWLNEEWARGHVDLQYGSEEFYQMVELRMQDPANRAWRVDCANAFLGFGS